MRPVIFHRRRAFPSLIKYNYFYRVSLSRHSRRRVAWLLVALLVIASAAPLFASKRQLRRLFPIISIGVAIPHNAAWPTQFLLQANGTSKQTTIRLRFLEIINQPLSRFVRQFERSLLVWTSRLTTRHSSLRNLRTNEKIIVWDLLNICNLVTWQEELLFFCFDGRRRGVEAAAATSGKKLTVESWNFIDEASVSRFMER